MIFFLFKKEEASFHLSERLKAEERAFESLGGIFGKESHHGR